MGSRNRMGGWRVAPKRAGIANLKSTRGAVAIEFALLVPILLALLLGALEYGRVIRERMQLASAARAGVQFALQNAANLQAITGATPVVCSAGLTGVQGAVCNATGLDPSTVTVTPRCECADGSTIACTGSCTVGGVGGPPPVYVRVTVEAQFRTLVPVNIPGFGEIIPASFPLIEEVTMRVR